MDSPETYSTGGEQPLPPEHSLPSYGEPTPETHRRITREEEAELALTSTTFSPGAKVAITALFLLTIVALPLINLAARLRPDATTDQPPGAGVIHLLPTLADLRDAVRTRRAEGIIPSAAEIKKAEKDLERDSVASQFLLPHVQSFLTGTLQAGNEQVYVGRDGWLFYRPDVDHITGPPFLDPARLKQRERDLHIQPDPLKAILKFHRELKERGIQLIVVPVPAKPGIDSHHLARPGERTPGGGRWILENLSTRQFFNILSERGIAVLNLYPEYIRASDAPGHDFYLQGDTHWTPETMKLAARALSASLYLPLSGHVGSGESKQTQRLADSQASALGDIAAMLKLPPNQSDYRTQRVAIQEVITGNSFWHPDKDADVLLIGDSFSNIYSLAAMGWGEHAGLAEHLSNMLSRPIDTILRNSDGAFATREILSKELARGRDRLAGKKVVIWEFAERELSFGDWKLLSTKLGSLAPPADFLALNDSEEMTVEATVAEVSNVPRPGTVPYQDHILSVQLEDIVGAPDSKTTGMQAQVYLWSMRNNKWTNAARLRVGDRVRVHLTSWPGREPSRESFNRSELPGAESQLAEPLWGELVER